MIIWKINQIIIKMAVVVNQSSLYVQHGSALSLVSDLFLPKCSFSKFKAIISNLPSNKCVRAAVTIFASPYFGINVFFETISVEKYRLILAQKVTLFERYKFFKGYRDISDSERLQLAIDNCSITVAQLWRYKFFRPELQNFKSSNKMHEESRQEKLDIALHEAGHIFLILWHNLQQLKRATILPNIGIFSGRAGFTHLEMPYNILAFKDARERSIEVLLGGEIATKVFDRPDNDTGCAEDLRFAHAISFGCDLESKKERVRHVLQDNMERVRLIANMLCDYEVLNFEDMYSLYVGISQTNFETAKRMRLICDFNAACKC